MSSPGYFILSLDTELSVGFFDMENERCARFSKDGKPERQAIHAVLSLCEKYNIAATWAITGFIFHQRDETPQPCPLENWQEEINRHAAAYDTTSPLCYGADIVQDIVDSPQPKEIGFHGYTHRVFTESKMDADEAQFEINEWKRLAARWHVIGTSIVFPRNAQGYLELLKDAGFICYRGHDHISRLYEFIPILESVDQLLSLSKLPLYDADSTAIDSNGLVNLPGSQHLFNFNHSIENILDSLKFHKLRLKRIFKGIETAAAEGKIVHLWAHPWEFRIDKDLEKLEAILAFVAQKSNQGRMHPITMTGMANIILKQASQEASKCQGNRHSYPGSEVVHS